jgi:hypothetical protein
MQHIEKSRFRRGEYHAVAGYRGVGTWGFRVFKGSVWRAIPLLPASRETDHSGPKFEARTLRDLDAKLAHFAATGERL